jgi:hypothetical protein
VALLAPGLAQLGLAQSGIDQVPVVVRSVAEDHFQLGSFVASVSTAFWALEPVGVAAMTTESGAGVVSTVDGALGLGATVSAASTPGSDRGWTVTQTSGGRTWTWNPVTRSRDWTFRDSATTRAGGGARPRTRLDATIDAPFVSWTATRSQGWSRGAGVSGSHTAARASVTLGQSAFVTGSIGVTDAGIGVGGAVHYEAGARASADVSVFGGPLGATVGVTAFVGARADVDVDLGIGLSGVRAKAHAGAHVGGEAETHGALTVAGVTGRAVAGVSWGAGAEADADLDLGWHRMEASGTIELTIGVGLKFGYDVSVDPAKTLKSVKNVAGSIAKHVPTPW